jgi:hypothetical protein
MSAANDRLFLFSHPPTGSRAIRRMAESKQSCHPDKRKSLARKCRVLFFRSVENLFS